MDGLIENQPESKNVKFLRVTSGTNNGKPAASLVEKVSKETPNAVSRINKLGVEVFEKHYYGGVCGTLKGLRVDVPKDAKYGRSIIIELKVNDMLVVITVAEASAFGRSLWKQIFHIDVNKKLNIVPYSFKPEDRIINGITLKQPVDNKFINLIKELPTGTPEVTGEQIRGEWVYDKKQQIKQEDFLQAALEEWTKKYNVFSKREETQSEETFLAPGVDNTPLTDDEKKQLKKPKYNNKPSVIEDDSDMFNDGFK